VESVTPLPPDSVGTLGFPAWATVAVLGVMMVGLVRELARPDLLLLGALGALLALGVVSPEQAFAGLSNSAVLAVASLFVVAAGVQSTGALAFTDRLLFPRSPSLPGALLRIMATTAAMSAFLNNTPIVAMLIPRLRAWSERTGIPAAKLMMPLSFGAILGGMTTLIGTSTNLLVSGLMEASGYPPLGLFDFAWVGVPAGVVAIAWFVLVGHRLLPDGSQGAEALDEGLEETLFEVRVQPGSDLVGRTVEEAGLRALGEAYLVHVRTGDHLAPSSPDLVLQPRDVLAFLGRPRALDRLLERPGLDRAIPSVERPEFTTLPLYEAVVAPSSSLVGRSLREAGFRDRYHGVVLGIHRRDEVIEGPLGRVPIQAGDLLLVEAPSDFAERWNREREEFYLVAPRRPEKLRPQRGKAPVALLILAGVVGVAALGWASIVTTAFIGALLMILTRCLRENEARKAVDIPVLVVIAAALGIGRAIEVSGLAGVSARALVEVASAFGTVGVLVAIYVATSLLTEMVTNNAAAALMIGVALAAAGELGAPPEAFGLAVAIAASASFLTPIGYQTNLMVMAAGGYRFGDYFRAGIAVNLLVAVTALTVITWHWL
jgi:di/tricarboxylate transporter